MSRVIRAGNQFCKLCELVVIGVAGRCELVIMHFSAFYAEVAVQADSVMQLR